MWSPLGTYLATFHWRGVALWAGPKFSQFQKFSHPYARFISFSPCENYLVTFCASNDRPEDKKLIIWDIRYAKLLNSDVVTDKGKPSHFLQFYKAGFFERSNQAYI